MKLINLHLRRVYWAICSPSLLSYPFSTNYIKDEAHKKGVLQLLHELDRKPALVNQHFVQLGPMPMGKYFEQLIFLILKHDDRYDVVLKNHQVIHEKQTIGEIDLILKDNQTQTLEHWEIALKFYLQSKPTSEHDVMLGPNAKDNLAKKMKKLTEHQLPLSTDLGELGFSTTSTIENRLLLKGQFFYHISHEASCNIFPNDVNPDHERGWWCHISEADSTLEKNLVWTTVRKPDWIGRTLYNDDHNLLNHNDLLDLLKQHFEQEDYAILCVGLQEENGCWVEKTKGFVVHNQWPKGSKN